LAHEVGDDSVKAASLESESFLTGAQSTEVLCRFGDNIGAQLHDDATGGFASNGDIEVALWFGPGTQIVRGKW
jgi:hypothetical protein